MNKTMKTNKTLKPIAELAVMLLAVSASAETINNDDIPVARPDDGVLLFIDAEEEVGPIKPMNAVNNGPNFLEHHDDPITSAEGVHEGRFDAFYAWSRLQRLGRQVRARLVGPDSALAAVAARGANGGLAVLVARCTGNANDFEAVPVKVSVRGRSLAGARLHVTDEFERHTERVLRVAPDGSATVRLAPHAFAVIEL